VLALSAAWLRSAPADAGDPPAESRRAEWAVGIVDANDDEYGECPEGITCLPENDTFTARVHEMTFVTVSNLASNSGEGDDLFFRWGLGFEVAPWLSRGAQWFRPAIFQTTSVGGWGDDSHGPINLEAGAKVRLSFMESRQLLDVYPVLGAGVILSPRSASQWGVRPSGGVGVRIFRAFSAELAFDLLHDLDGGFAQPGGGSTPWIYGASTLVGVDTCAFGDWCDHDGYRQEHDDLTCCTEDAAGEACRDAGEIGRAATHATMCAAVTEALDTPQLCQRLADTAGVTPTACGGQVEPTTFEACVDDPVGATLLYVARVLGPTHPSTAKLCTARKGHLGRLGWRAQGKAQERKLSQRGRALARRRVYAPFVSDLRVALGCAPPARLEGRGGEREGPPAAACAAGACAPTARMHCALVTPR
jgi:hypothetical protein